MVVVVVVLVLVGFSVGLVRSMAQCQTWGRTPQRSPRRA